MLEKNPNKRPQSFAAVAEAPRSHAKNAQLKELVANCSQLEPREQELLNHSLKPSAARSVGGKKWGWGTWAASVLAVIAFGVLLGIIITVRSQSGEMAQVALPSRLNLLMENRRRLIMTISLVVK